MGWREDTGLGRAEGGIVEPIRVEHNDQQLGLGKAEEFEQAAEVATRDRRRLEIEIEATPEVARRREESQQRIERTEARVATMNRTFYCETCRKQYKNAGELTAHLSSYDHHHVKRLKELKETERAAQAGAKRRRAEKQAQRELNATMARANAASLVARTAREAATTARTEGALNNFPAPPPGLVAITGPPPPPPAGAGAGAGALATGVAGASGIGGAVAGGATSNGAPSTKVKVAFGFGKKAKRKKLGVFR